MKHNPNGDSWRILMKKLLALLLVCIYILPLAAAGKQESGKPASSPEQIKLVFATNEQPILNQSFWKIPSEKFMKANPGVVIENISQPSSNITLWEHLKVLLATGQFPDVMVLNSVAEFAPMGVLLELSLDDLDMVSIPEIGAYEGRFFLYPYKKMLNGVFYNKRIFQNAGLKEPSTYAELIQLSQTLKSSGVTPFALGIRDGWPQICLGSAILTSDLLVKNPNWISDLNAGKTKFNSPEFRRSMEKYIEISKNYCNQDMMSVSYAQMLEMFFTGKTAMMPMGSWVLGEEQRLKPDFEVGFFPFLADSKADTAVAIYANEGIAISATTKHPEKAKEFARFFLTDKEWYGKFLETEMLFPTTKETVPYSMSATRKQVEERIKGLKEIPTWGDMPNPNSLLPGLQSYFNSFLANLSAGSDLTKELNLFDREWEAANRAIKK